MTPGIVFGLTAFSVLVLGVPMHPLLHRLLGGFVSVLVVLLAYAAVATGVPLSETLIAIALGTAFGGLGLVMFHRSKLGHLQIRR